MLKSLISKNKELYYFFGAIIVFVCSFLYLFLYAQFTNLFSSSHTTMLEFPLALISSFVSLWSVLLYVGWHAKSSLLEKSLGLLFSILGACFCIYVYVEVNRGIVNSLEQQFATQVNYMLMSPLVICCLVAAAFFSPNVKKLRAFFIRKLDKRFE